MKKLFLILVIILAVCPISYSQASEGQTIEGVVITSGVNYLQVLLTIDGAEDKIFSSDLYFPRTCAVEDFKAGEIITIQKNLNNTSLYPELNDEIVSKSSFNDLFDAGTPIPVTNCAINTVVNNTNEFYNLYFNLKINETSSFSFSMDGSQYLISNQSSCLETQLGPFAIIFIKQQDVTQLTQDDVLAMGVNIPLDFNAINPLETLEFKKLTACTLGTPQKIVSNIGEIVEISGTNEVIVNDNIRAKKLALTVDSTCNAIKDPTNYISQFASIIYNASDINFEKPIYLASMGSLELTDITGIENLFKGNLCAVSASRVIGDITVPTTDWTDWTDNWTDNVVDVPTDVAGDLGLTNYYIGLYGKKVYTDRPDVQLLIGLLIKGETDPATYMVDIDGVLRWLETEEVAASIFGDDWNEQIIWFSDAIIYTYPLGESIS